MAGFGCPLTIMPLIIEIYKVTGRVKVENTQLMTENTTLKSENSKLKEHLSKLNTEPPKPVIHSKPRVFTDESMRDF